MLNLGGAGEEKEIRIHVVIQAKSTASIQECGVAIMRHR